MTGDTEPARDRAHGKPGPQAQDGTFHECFVRDEQQLETVSWDDPVRGRIDFKTFFGDGTPTGPFVAGTAEVPPAAAFSLHRHDAAETYYIVEGDGVVTLDGKNFHVAAGFSVYIPSGMEHGIRNIGELPLKLFYVLAADSFADVEYQFSTSNPVSP